MRGERGERAKERETFAPYREVEQKVDEIWKIQ